MSAIATLPLEVSAPCRAADASRFSQHQTSNNAGAVPAWRSVALVEADRQFQGSLLAGAARVGL